MDGYLSTVSLVRLGDRLTMSTTCVYIQPRSLPEHEDSALIAACTIHYRPNRTLVTISHAKGPEGGYQLHIGKKTAHLTVSMQRPGFHTAM